MKKYIKTIEELLALKDTNTPIFNEANDKYLKFVDGVLCSYNEDGVCGFNVAVGFNTSPFIEAEEAPQEVTEKDIGKLCLFYDYSDVFTVISVLGKIVNDNEYIYITKQGTKYKHCRRLTEEEIKEIV